MALLNMFTIFTGCNLLNLLIINKASNIFANPNNLPQIFSFFLFWTS